MENAVTLHPIGVNITNIKMAGKKMNAKMAKTTAIATAIESPIISQHLHQRVHGDHNLAPEPQHA